MSLHVIWNANQAVRIRLLMIMMSLIASSRSLPDTRSAFAFDFKVYDGIATLGKPVADLM